MSQCTVKSLIRTICAIAVLGVGSASAFAQPKLSSSIPADIPGGAANATHAAAAEFAWQEFVAVTWPAIDPTANSNCEKSTLNTRSTPAPGTTYGAKSKFVVWETMRNKEEIYPGDGKAPNAYDACPKYLYSPTSVGTATGAVPPAPGQQPVAIPAFVNLSEDNEIEQANMYSGDYDYDPNAKASDFPKESQMILYLAKANRFEYDYVVKNGYYGSEPSSPYFATTANWVRYQMNTPKPSTAVKGKYVSFPYGTIEIKSAWRRLTAAQVSSGKYHMQLIRYYEAQNPMHTYNGKPGVTKYPAWREEVRGLIGLHIIHKTPTAPYFVYATFEHNDNLLTKDGKNVEDEAGNIINECAPPPQSTNCTTSPTDPMVVSTAAQAHTDQSVTVKAGATANPGHRLYYKNVPGTVTPSTPISIVRRYHSIPQPVIDTNKAYQAAIKGQSKGSPWSNYKLINVQWMPLDKTAQGAGKPYKGKNPGSYYLSNSVIETDFNLQNFSGKLAALPPHENGLITDYYNKNSNPPGTTIGEANNNVSFNGRNYNMGGCMGCHGNIAQLGSDYSFLLFNGKSGTAKPEYPGSDE